jgi:transcriptional regulator with XRE-family HTH domain
MNMDFFDRVKDLVKQKTTLTLRAFVESMGLNYETYYSGKRRITLPRADEAQKIAAALGTTVEYLVTGKDPARPDTAKALKHLEAVQDFLKGL